MEPKVITVSDTFHCAECKRKLVVAAHYFGEQANVSN